MKKAPTAQSPTPPPKGGCRHCHGTRGGKPVCDECVRCLGDEGCGHSPVCSKHPLALKQAEETAAPAVVEEVADER